MKRTYLKDSSNSINFRKAKTIITEGEITVQEILIVDFNKEKPRKTIDKNIQLKIILQTDIIAHVLDNTLGQEGHCDRKISIKMEGEVGNIKIISKQTKPI